MFGFSDWNDFSTKAQEKFQTATSQAKESLIKVQEQAKESLIKAQEQVKVIGSITKESILQVSYNVHQFIEDEFKYSQNDTELKKRKQLKKVFLEQNPPWYIKNIDLNDPNIKQTMNDLKLRILKICEEESNFFIQAPKFEFYMETALPYAISALKFDPILPVIRFNLVPKRLLEEQFWENYFYRVQLVRESMGIEKLDLSKTHSTQDIELGGIILSSNKNLNNKGNESNSIFESPNDSSNKNTEEELKPANNDKQDIQNLAEEGRNNSIDASSTSSFQVLDRDEIENDAQNSKKKTESNSKTSPNENKLLVHQNDKNQHQNEQVEEDHFMASEDLNIDNFSKEQREKIKVEFELHKNQQSDAIENVDDLIPDVGENDSEISEGELAKVVSEVEQL